MRSVNYPIKHTVSDGIYNVYEQDCEGNRTLLFTGRSYTNGAGSIDIDLSDIAQRLFKFDNSVSGETPSVEFDINVTDPIIIEGGGTYIIIGSGGTYYTSFERTKWEQHELIFTERIVAISFGYTASHPNGIFVAVGEDGVVGLFDEVGEVIDSYYINDNANPVQYLNAVTFGNGKFVTTGVYTNSPSDAVSFITDTPENPTSWQSTALPLSSEVAALAYSPQSGETVLNFDFTQIASKPAIVSENHPEYLSYLERCGGFNIDVIAQNGLDGSLSTGDGWQKNGAPVFGATIDGFQAMQINQSLGGVFTRVKAGQLFEGSIYIYATVTGQFIFGNEKGDISYVSVTADMLNQWTEVTTSFESGEATSSDGLAPIVIYGGTYNASQPPIYLRDVTLTQTTENTLKIGQLDTAGLYANNIISGRPAYDNLLYQAEVYIDKDPSIDTGTPYRINIANSDDTFTEIPSTQWRQWITVSQPVTAPASRESLRLFNRSVSYVMADVYVRSYKIFDGLSPDNGIFVGVSQDSIEYTLDDSQSWLSGSISANYNFQDVLFDGRRFVAVGYTGNKGAIAVCYPYDITNWKVLNIPDLEPLYNISYSNGVYAIAGKGFALASRDLATFRAEQYDKEINDVIIRNNVVTIVGDDFIANLSNNSTSIGSTGFVRDIYIDNNPAVYTVAYDYNTDYMSEIGEQRINNDPITGEILIGQKVPFSFYDEVCGRSKQINFSVNGTLIETQMSSERSINGWYNTAPLVVSQGDILTIDVTGDGFNYSFKYKFITPCNTRYIVHYINKYGAVDSLVIKGGTTVSYTNSSTRIDGYYDRSNPESFQHSVIQNTATRRWTFNTAFLTDEQSRKIDHLILSPWVIVEDLYEGIKYAALISNTSFTIQQFRQNMRRAQYDITIDQSQDIIRR